MWKLVAVWMVEVGAGKQRACLHQSLDRGYLSSTGSRPPSEKSGYGQALKSQLCTASKPSITHNLKKLLSFFGLVAFTIRIISTIIRIRTIISIISSVISNYC